MQLKRYVIDTLVEISEVSNRIRLDMLKNILNLPVFTFIEGIGECIKDNGFRLEDKFISFESESIPNIIEILDQKFKEWQMNSYSIENLGKIEHAISTTIETVPLDSEIHKYQILQNLAFFEDLDALKLYSTIQIIIDNVKSKSDLVSLIQEENVSNSPKPEEIVSLFSKKYSFREFISTLHRITSSNQLNQIIPEDAFLERSIIFRRSNMPLRVSKFFNEFKIRPISIIEIKNNLFIFLRNEDYFEAKSHHRKIQHLLHGKKVKFLRHTDSLIRLIFAFFPDHPFPDFQIDRKNHTINFQYSPSENQIEPEVLNELFNNHIIFADFTWLEGYNL